MADGITIVAAHRHHADLYGYLAVLTLVAHDFFRRIGADELTHKGVILHTDVVDQAVDGTPRRLPFCPHERAEGRDVGLHHRAADDEAARAGPQYSPDLQTPIAHRRCLLLPWRVRVL